jgi:hypothetical protein
VFSKFTFIFNFDKYLGVGMTDEQKGEEVSYHLVPMLIAAAWDTPQGVVSGGPSDEECHDRFSSEKIRVYHP